MNETKPADDWNVGLLASDGAAKNYHVKKMKNYQLWKQNKEK